MAVKDGVAVLSGGIQIRTSVIPSNAPPASGRSRANGRVGKPACRSAAAWSPLRQVPVTAALGGESAASARAL